MVSLQNLYFVTLTYFLKVKNKKVNISKMAKDNAKSYTTAFTDFDDCQQMIQLGNLHLIILIYFFKVKEMKF